MYKERDKCEENQENVFRGLGSNSIFFDGINKECSAKTSNLFSNQIMNLDVVYRKGVSIGNIFSLGDVNEPLETVQCRFQVLYFILQNELIKAKERKQKYIDSKGQDNLLFDGPPDVSGEQMLYTIHHGYVRVLQLLIEQVYGQSLITNFTK